MKVTSFILLACLIYFVKSQCSNNHPYVGFIGDLATHQHQVKGTVEIIDDCTFRVRGFGYDGTAPAAYWWGIGDDTNFRNGFRINNDRVARKYNNEIIEVKLQGKTWNDFKNLYLWCEYAAANLGSVPLKSSSIAPMPPTVEPVYDNCVTLSDNNFNLHWNLNKTEGVVYFQYEINLGLAEGKWAAFGYSNPNLPPSMVGSDVTVAGFFNNTPYAIDYKITARSQCDTTGTSGVCPDSSLGNDAVLDNVKLNSGEVVNGITFIRFSRPLNTTDAKYDFVIDPDVNMSTVWAYGPLSQDITKPVVLYHGDSKFAGKLLKLSDKINDCKPIVMDITTVNQTKGDPSKIETLSSDVKSFYVTIGDNPNYPNPPGWGISLHINGKESPVLTVKRYTEVEFVVAAGDSHPFYITLSIIGGGLPNDVVYAGGVEAFGNRSKPYIVKWIPHVKVPNVVYYQCYAHQKLGWKIIVEDSSIGLQIFTSLLFFILLL